MIFPFHFILLWQRNIKKYIVLSKSSFPFCKYFYLSSFKENSERIFLFFLRDLKKVALEKEITLGFGDGLISEIYMVFKDHLCSMSRYFFNMDK
ncbi:hypothetical protein C1631_020970 [Chryseobacterium phosphatilyticum]|uniref:Uncharacterized protein n=1 Tax=Chryseobacterium phosphatilyticum TaxID=475075 RepID=A0A316WV74_9FLAO|nr:hypothetical protein C1631_020970 [Chryseobacterium phosphatilyticum]